MKSDTGQGKVSGGRILWMLKIKSPTSRVLVGLDATAGFGSSTTFCGGVFETRLVRSVTPLWDFPIKSRWREISGVTVEMAGEFS